MNVINRFIIIASIDTLTSWLGTLTKGQFIFGWTGGCIAMIIILMKDFKN